MLEEIDTHIQGRIQISKDLHQRKLGDEATKGQETIRAVHKVGSFSFSYCYLPCGQGTNAMRWQDLINTTTAIRTDLHFTRDLKAKTDQAVQDTIVATRLVDGFRNPHANAAYLKDHAGFPLEYVMSFSSLCFYIPIHLNRFFTRVTVQMRERLAWYKSTIEVRSLSFFFGYDADARHSKSSVSFPRPPAKRNIRHTVRPSVSPPARIFNIVLDLQASTQPFKRSTLRSSRSRPRPRRSTRNCRRSSRFTRSCGERRRGVIGTRLRDEKKGRIWGWGG
jgi:hypothetical protein